MESIAGDFTVTPAQATADPGKIGNVDFVLLCTKTWQVPAAVTQLRLLIGAETGVVTLQNGVEIPESVGGGRPGRGTPRRSEDLLQPRPRTRRRTPA